MKKFSFVFLFLIATPAMAVDYSGCIPAPASPAVSREYSLSKDGKLVMPRGPGTIRAESTDSKDTLSLKMPEGVKGSQVFELIRSGGKPSSLSHNFPLFGGQNPQRATITRNFKYAGDKCYLGEMTLVYTHGSDAKKKLVTYDHGMCDELSAKFDGSQKKLAACSGEFQKIVDIMEANDDRMRNEGKELFGFDRKKSRADPFDIILHTMANCNDVRRSYPFAYQKARGFRIPGFSFPGIRVRPAEPEDHKDGGGISAN